MNTAIAIEPEISKPVGYAQPLTPKARGWLSEVYASVAATISLAILVSVVYPLITYAIGQVVFPIQANGSLVKRDGTFTKVDSEAVGSSWMAQGFSAPQYFQPRPSDAGSGYDPTSSGGSNLGPTSDKFLNGIHGSKNADGTANPSADYDGVKDLAAAYRAANGLAADAPVPEDAVTRSGSGLDPEISPENADIQADRVAKARGVSADKIRAAVADATHGRDLGVFGETRVNVLMLNLELDQKYPLAAPTTGK